MGMISPEYANRTDRLMRATTSLTVAPLGTAAAPALPARIQADKTVAGKPRQRQPGKGGKACMASEEQKLYSSCATTEPARRRT